MSFNGSGTFNRLYNWVNDRVNGIKILATRMDAEMDGFATGLSTCVTKDGQTTPTANLPMGGFKHTGVAAATATTEYATLGQLRANVDYFVATGTNTYAITPSPTFSAYAAGMAFDVLFTNGNTGAATLNVNGLGTKALTKNVSTALVSGDIAAGKIYRVVYDGTRFQVKDTAGDVSSNTASSVDSEIALFSGTGGKTVKRATGTGFAKVVNGVLQTPVATIGTTEIADDAVTLAKMAGGTDGNLITYDSSGNPAYVATGTAGQVLTSNGAGAAPVFADAPTSPAGLEVIATATPTGTSSVSFTSIPQTYRGLLFVLDAISHNGASQYVQAVPYTNTAEQLSAQGFAVNNTTVSFLNNFLLGTALAVTSAQTISGNIFIPQYYANLYSTAVYGRTYSGSMAVNSVQYTIQGGINNHPSLDTGVTRVDFNWSLGSNYDAGTITLYGIL